MEQKGQSRNKSTYLWSIDFQQNYQGNSPEKEMSLQQMVLEQLAIHMLWKQTNLSTLNSRLNKINAKV